LKTPALVSAKITGEASFKKKPTALDPSATSPQDASAIPSPRYKNICIEKLFGCFMFSASKVGGSRGSTSQFFRAGTPSYTHITEGPARLFFYSSRVHAGGA
jgi:hypothetical protein